MTRPARILLGVAAIGLIAAIAFLAAARLVGSGDEMATGSPDAATPPFTVPRGEPSEIASARINVQASSHLEPDSGITYDPENLIDGDLATAWNSDSLDPEGRGELLTFRFSEPVDLRAVRFVNGYVKNDGVYDANHRVQKLLVRTDASDTAQPVTLLDTGDRQEISFDFGLTSKVSLEIVGVYVGDGFDNSELTTDLAITEVSFIAVQP